jgi:hypothetical protein
MGGTAIGGCIPHELTEEHKLRSALLSAADVLRINAVLDDPQNVSDHTLLTQFL